MPCAFQPGRLDKTLSVAVHSESDVAFIVQADALKDASVVGYQHHLSMTGLVDSAPGGEVINGPAALTGLVDSAPGGEVINGPAAMNSKDTVLPVVQGPRVVIVTLFTELYPGPLGVSLLGKALADQRWILSVVSLKDFGVGHYGAIDDTCYGGGAGMVLRPDVVDQALRRACTWVHKPVIIYMTPRGQPLAQHHVNIWASAKRDMVILCGRYEGVDQRVLDHWNVVEMAVGDAVLCGGDIPAMALVEAYVRLLPGVVGNPCSLVGESFQQPLLEHPLYTRPAMWKGQSVPEILLTGNHYAIQTWQKQQAYTITQQRRPDLWARYCWQQEQSCAGLNQEKGDRNAGHASGG